MIMQKEKRKGNTASWVHRAKMGEKWIRKRSGEDGFLSNWGQRGRLGFSKNFFVKNEKGPQKKTRGLERVWSCKGDGASCVENYTTEALEAGWAMRGGTRGRRGAEDPSF